MSGTHGEYQLLDRINTGGMAEVFRARLRGVGGFERIFAVKRILPEIARDRVFVEMFLDEARIAAQLNHPNIIKTIDLGVSDGAYFIAMEYVEGVDVRALFRRCRDAGSPIPQRHACRIVAEVCEALSYAHNRRDARGRPMNVVHRDVSPPNVMVTREGEVKLIDFGVAKAAERTARTQAGVLKGKIAYIAPEQVLGEPADRRADIFAAGIVLWELLANERLFEGLTDFAVLEKIRRCAHAPPSARNPSVPPELDAIVARALARDPAERFQDAIELCDRLRDYAETSGERSSARALATWTARVMSDEPASDDDMPTQVRPRRRRRSRSNRNVIRRAARGTPPGPLSPVPEATPADVRVYFESTPPGASVFVVAHGARQKIGTTPVVATLPRAVAYDVSIRKPGFTTFNEHLSFGNRAEITVTATLRAKSL